MDGATIPQWLTFVAACLTFLGVSVGFLITYRQLRHNQYVRETENLLSVVDSTVDHDSTALQQKATLEAIRNLEGLNIPPTADDAEVYWTTRSLHLSHLNLVWRVWELAGRPGRRETMNSRFDGFERFARHIIARKLEDSVKAVESGGSAPEDLAGSDLWTGMQAYEIYPTKFVEWLDGLNR